MTEKIKKVAGKGKGFAAEFREFIMRGNVMDMAVGVINQADYCTSKSGIIGLTRALALEFAQKGVRVNAIAPGMIMTDMLRGVNQDELNALAATIPQGFIGDVSDIAGALGYLLTAPYVTGQVISPNGGIVQQ